MCPPPSPQTLDPVAALRSLAYQLALLFPERLQVGVCLNCMYVGLSSLVARALARVVLRSRSSGLRPRVPLDGCKARSDYMPLQGSVCDPNMALYADRHKHKVHALPGKCVLTQNGITCCPTQAQRYYAFELAADGDGGGGSPSGRRAVEAVAGVPPGVGEGAAGGGGSGSGPGAEGTRDVVASAFEVLLLRPLQLLWEEYEEQQQQDEERQQQGQEAGGHVAGEGGGGGGDAAGAGAGHGGGCVQPPRLLLVLDAIDEGGGLEEALAGSGDGGGGGEGAGGGAMLQLVQVC